MKESVYLTPCGPIHYWTAPGPADVPALVLLPGLTADHRLFRPQIGAFEGRCPLLVWDAPGHAASWPFELSFDLSQKARWLHEILLREGLERPVLVGQSMGGYLGQMYAHLFPQDLSGLCIIDAAPLQRCYYTKAELWLLERMEPVYLHYPWNLLVKQGCEGVAVTPGGRALMREMMLTYAGDQRRYAALSGHGFRMLAQAVKRDIDPPACPMCILCGEQDHAGSCIRYNRAWERKTGIPVHWIKDAGHNANTDRPETVNRLLWAFLQQVSSPQPGPR